jgi:hypothetical protein
MTERSDALSRVQFREVVLIGLYAKLLFYLLFLTMAAMIMALKSIDSPLKRLVAHFGQSMHQIRPTD